MRSRLAQLLVLGMCLLWADVAAAQTKPDHGLPIQLTADSLEFERERAIYIADGHVRIVRGDRSIEADWVVFSAETERGIASGGVVFRDGSQELLAEFLQFDVNTLQGLVYRATLDTGAGGFVVDADRILRTGDDQYTIRGGVFTTCRCEEGERDPWSFRASKSNVELGGYATAQNTTLSVLGVPVIWLPWMFFPIKTERESGLLLPLMGYTKSNGFVVGLPLFWAARENLNVLLTPIYLSERGYKQNVRLEYLNGKRSGGEIFGAFLHDQVRADASLPDGHQGDEDRINRWALRVEHDQYLPANWIVRADINLISDNEYTEDFEEMRRFRNDLYLESEIFGFNHFTRDGRVGVTASVSHANDLQMTDSLDRDEILNNRLPNLHAEVLSAPARFAASWVTRFEADYTYFHSNTLPQNKFGTDGLVGDSLFMDIGVNSQPFDADSENRLLSTPAGEADFVFNEGEALADRGHRFIFHPRLARPFRLLDRFEFYPEVGYREILYTTAAQDFAQQGHVTARADLRSRWIGRLAGLDLEHVVEPLLNWTLVSHASGSGVPLLTPATATPQYRIRQFARENLVADPSDRVNSRNTLTLGIANRFYRAGNHVADFRVSVDYNWMGGGTRYSVTDDEPDISHFIISGAALPFYPVATKFNLTLDNRTKRVDEGLASLSYTPWSWFAIGGSYRYRDRIPANTARFFETIVSGENPWEEATDPLSEFGGTARLTIANRMTIRYAATYDVVAKYLVRNTGSVEFRGRCDCWAIGFQVKDERGRDVRFTGSFTLLGIGADDVMSSPLNSGSFFPN